MWNQKPTATTTNTAATSEKSNKEKEVAAGGGEGDDCSCGSGGGGGVLEASVEKQHDKKTAIENNSKKSTFGGKTSFDQQSSTSSSGGGINKQKEFAASETSDSGFISGPQSTQIFSEEILDNQSDNEDDNKLEQQQQQQQKQKNPTVAIVLDSGIIDEEEEEEEVGQEQAGAVSEAAEMRFKQNVEAGIPQWTVQSSLATGGMNNLNSTTISSTNASASGKRNTTTPNPAAAASNSNINIINAWEKFFQQNDDGDTPLHLACISGYVDVVTALIRMAPHPCLLNIQNDEAQTPLHLAALTAQPNILRMLLLAGAEPTVRDRHGNTALHLSCIAGEKQCVRALTETFGAIEIHEAHRNYGHRSNDKTVSSLSYARLPADLEICNYDGERCVHLAAQSGHIDILRILVSHGADINAREGKSGRTPLHIAIEACNEDLANFLLDECEKLNLETATYAGLTAYQVACILNKSRMQNILEKRGAETITPPESDYDYDSSDIEDLDDTKGYDRFGDPGYFIGYNGGNPMTVA